MFPFTKPAEHIVSAANINQFIMRYAKKDNWHNLDRKTANLGYGWLHYALIRIQQPARVLCVGSRYGFIPAICALACKDNRKGHVDFVDAGFNQDINEPNHWGGLGIWKKIIPSKYFNFSNLHRHLSLHLMTTADYVHKNPHSRWEYVYLDGDHSYNGVKSDYDRFYPKVTKGGFILFHDSHMNPDKYLDYGVKRFINTLPSVHRIDLPGTYGLSIIQKE